MKRKALAGSAARGKEVAGQVATRHYKATASLLLRGPPRL